MIAKRVVLLRIKNLEQRRGWIAAIVVAEFVDFVEHQHRIVHARAANRLDNAARHGADVGTPVTAQFSLVTYAPERHSFKLPPQ